MKCWTESKVKSTSVMCVWTVILLTAMGCGLDADGGNGSVSRTGCVEVMQVPIRHCERDPLKRVPEDAAITFVNAVVSGDLAKVDALLSERKIGINEVVCLTEVPGVRRGKLLINQTLFRPPELGENVGATYKRYLNAYVVNSTHDTSLEGNAHIEFYGTPLMMAARAGNPALVSLLLKKGANPNVFVQTGGIDAQRKGQVIGTPLTVAGGRPWAVMCALTECYVRTTGKYIENEDGCAAILLKHGAKMPPVNSQGQTALWAAAQLRSRFLLEQFVKMGADVNQKDGLGMTVADYVSREIETASGENLRREYGMFLQVLQGFGAKVTGGGGIAPGRALVPEAKSYPMVQPGASGTAKQEHSAEIAAIEIQLKDLRRQLVEAKHDANMGVVTGTSASLSAQMRVMSLVNAIHERERRLAALQE